MSGVEPAWWLVTRKAPPRIGGMERLSGELVTRLAQRNSVQVIAHAGGKFALPGFLSLAMRRLAAGADRGEVALLHLGDPVLAPLARVARSRGIPTAVTIHGLDVVYANPLYRAWRKAFLHELDAYICLSHAARDAAVDAGIARERTYVIGIGIDLPPASIELREAERLLFVGRLVRRKGLAWFVRDVLPEVAARRPALKLAIVGVGPERRAVESAAHTAGIAGRLEWLGALDDDSKAREYARATVCVMPNVPVAGDLEGYGIVALEAAAAGCPLLAANLEGLRDAVIDGETGLLLPPLDPAAWQAALRAWLDDESARRAAGARARDAVVAHRGWDPVIAGYATLFESLVAEKCASSRR